MSAVQLKRSAVAGKIPLTADLQTGELAMNTNDGRVYMKKTVGGSDSITRIGGFNITTTAVNKTIVAEEHVTVTAATKTITLPASPVEGDTVCVSVGAFTDTVIARNGSTIMSLAEDLTVDKASATVTLRYIGSTWRIV